MLPLVFSTLKNEYKPYVKSILLMSDSNFGHQTSNDHYLERLNNFVETGKTLDPFILYSKLASLTDNEFDHDITSFNNNSYQQKLFLNNKNISLHDIKRLGDGNLKLHYTLANSLERNILKNINMIDHIAIMD